MKGKFLAVLVAVITLTSCAGLTQVTVPQSNINYIGEDIETCRRVDFTLVKTYFLGIGGMSERARNTNIIDELMKKANLQTNESLAYISVSKNVNSFLIFTEVKLTASGYVVRPVKEESPELVHDESDYMQGSEYLSTKQMKQLYKSLNRRILYAVTRDDLIKIKEDIDNDVAAGKLSSEYSQKLLDKIYDRLLQ